MTRRGWVCGVLVGTVLIGAAFSGAALEEWVAQGDRLRSKASAHWTQHVVYLSLSLIAAAGALGRVLRRAFRGDQPGKGGLPLRAFFVLAVLAAAAYLAFWQPFRRLTLFVGFGEAAGIYSLLVLLGAAWWPKSRGLRLVDYGLFNLCLFLVLAEIGLRVAGRYSSSMLLDQGSVASEEWIRRYMCKPGRPHFGIPCNRQGHFDTTAALDERDGPLVVSIGDSFSLSIVPLHYHFTTVCERALPGVEVYNMGVAGAGPPEYLYMMVTQALPLDPELIVVNLFVGNDIRCPGQRAEDRQSRTLRLWFDRNHLLVYNFPVRWMRWQEEKRKQGGVPLVMTGGRGKGRAGFWDSLEETLEHMPWLEDPLLERATFSKGAFRRIELIRVLDGCRPGVSDYVGVFVTIERIVAAAGDTPLAFVLIPDEFQVEDAVWNEIRSRRPEQDFDRILPQKVLGAWFEERGIPYLDLLPRLAAAEPLEDGRRHVYHLRDTHFNARGNAVVGEALAEFLGDLDVLP